MINLEQFQKSLKTNWLQKIFQEENTPWRKLFQFTINFSYTLLMLGIMF